MFTTWESVQLVLLIVVSLYAIIVSVLLVLSVMRSDKQRTELPMRPHHELLLNSTDDEWLAPEEHKMEEDDNGLFQ